MGLGLINRVQIYMVELLPYWNKKLKPENIIGVMQSYLKKQTQLKVICRGKVIKMNLPTLIKKY